MESGQSAERRRLFVWADELELTREERIEIAQYMLRRDITSWKQLTEGQVMRLLDAFEGHHLIDELLRQRVTHQAG